MRLAYDFAFEGSYETKTVVSEIMTIYRDNIGRVHFSDILGENYASLTPVDISVYQTMERQLLCSGYVSINSFVPGIIFDYYDEEDDK